jgi:hypothetical protein
LRARRLLVLVTLLLAVSAWAPAVGQASPAPVLNADGETLKWTGRTRDVYELLTSAPGSQRLSTVVGRTITPPAVPGATVVYRVKAADSESAWSNEVSITYSSGGGGGAPLVEGGELPFEGGEPAPAVAEPAPAVGEAPLEGWEAPLEAGEAPLGEEGLLYGAGAWRPEEAAGRPKYRLDAATYFAPFGTAQYAPWVKAHISVIKGYPPFSDFYVGLFGLPLIAYHDPATEGQAPLGQAGINAYLAKVRRDMAVGYAGVFVDDANWTAGFNPSPGPRAALANLLVAIRAAEPKALIEMNSQYHDIWPLMKNHDPNVERALGVVNLVTKEFGVGPSAGIATGQDYGELFQFIDTLHSKGIHVVMSGDQRGNNVPTMEYGLATYLLANDGGDLVNGDKQTPLHWWRGFDVNLGDATTHRERSPRGVWKRVFSGGVVYTVEPGAATQTIKLGKRMHSAQWGTVESVTLAAGQGAVLVG